MIKKTDSFQNYWPVIELKKCITALVKKFYISSSKTLIIQAYLKIEIVLAPPMHGVQQKKINNFLIFSISIFFHLNFYVFMKFFFFNLQNTK